MPFVLPAAAAAVAAAAPAVAATATAAAGQAALMVSLKALAFNALTNLAVSTAMSVLQPQVGMAGRSFEFIIDPDGPIPFAAGRIGVPGSVVHRDTFGPNLMYYGVPAVLSGAGPIDSIESFTADDEVVTFDGTGKAISSQYAGELWFKSKLGDQPDTALVSPTGLKNSVTLPGWTSAHKLSGKACYLIVMGENSKQSAFPTGEIKPLITLRGLKVWDPRLDSTWPGGSGSCRLATPSTWVYSTNPLLWALKWALGLWEGPTGQGAPQIGYQVGGIGAKLSGIDVAAFVSGANIADANSWTISAYPNTDDDKNQVLGAFLQAGGCIYAQRAGKISCIQRAAPRSSIVTLSAADTAGPLEIDTAASRIDRINTIRPRYWSEAHRWQMTAMPQISVSAYVTEDGGTRPRGVDYPFVNNATQAGQLAALQIANTREGIAGVIPLKPHLQRIRPGDAFTITEPGFVLDGLKCLCLNTDYDPATGAVRVSFVSETDGKYSYALGLSPTPPATQTLTAADYTVAAPTVSEWALVATVFVDGGVSIPALLITGAVDNARAQSVIFEYRVLGAANWAFAGAEDPTVVRKEIPTITAGTQYEVALSYRIGGRISFRLVLGPVTAGSLVAGDVTPIVPGTVSGTPALSIVTAIQPDGTQTSRLFGTWTAPTNALTYIVEIDDGTLVQQVPLTENAIEDHLVATGPTYRYRVKALSRTGNLSAAWSSWSGSVVAAGDTTPPGAVTSASLAAMARRIVVSWVNPTDADFSHVQIFRNTTNTTPTGGTTPYVPRFDGSFFTDTNVVAGTTYHYWIRTFDRSGNGNAIFQYFGSATPSYITVGGGDVNPSDPDLVTGNWMTTPNLDSVSVLRRSGGGGFIYTGDLAATVGARAGTNLFASDGVTQVTRLSQVSSSDGAHLETVAYNAGTTLNLFASGSDASVQGNTIARAANATGSWGAGAYSYEWQRNSAYASVSAPNPALAHGTMFGFADAGSKAPTYANLRYGIFFTSAGNIDIYESNVAVASSITTYATGDHFYITYDNVNVTYWKNGTAIRTVATTAGRPFYFQATFGSGIGATLTNIQFGPYTDNAWASVGGTGRPADNATDDTTVNALSAGLASGAVKPLEAQNLTGQGALALKNTADTADIAAYAVNAPFAISEPSGNVDLKSTSLVLIGSVTITNTLADEQISVTLTMSLEGLGATGGTRGDYIGSLNIYLQRGDSSDPYSVLTTPVQRVVSVNRDMRVHTTLCLTGEDLPGAQSSVTYYAYGVMSSVSNITSVSGTARKLKVQRQRR